MKVKVLPHRACACGQTSALGSHMTKRRHADKSVTASTPSALRAEANGVHYPHLDTTGNPSAKKKSKVCKGVDREVVSIRTASDDLDIDDIFQRARHKKQAPVSIEKVCVLFLGIARYFCCRAQHFSQCLMQKLAVVSKPPRVIGSKDDLFGTGQPKQRRYWCASCCLPGVDVAVVQYVVDRSRVLDLPPVCRYDPEGLPVYTPEELNVGAGGETDKCPFDCDCCY